MALVMMTEGHQNEGGQSTNAMAVDVVLTSARGIRASDCVGARVGRNCVSLVRDAYELSFLGTSCQILLLPLAEERGEAPQETFHPRGYLGSKHGGEERRVVRISYYDKRL